MTNQSLAGLVEALRTADRDDDEAFHSLLVAGFDLLQLVDKDIAREFGVSRPTVTRWRNGQNAPHPAMRKIVYSWLDRRASQLIQRAPPKPGTQGSLF